MGMFKRTFKPNEKPVRSNQLSDRPAQSIHYQLFVFPRYSSLCYRTIQANLFFQALPSIQPNRCEYTRTLFAFSTFGCYIRSTIQNTSITRLNTISSMTNQLMLYVI
ncbi:hypothetical protein Hanom_Chr02g00146591 [Helianthus anomalus]